ncbi:MAG TPA: AI-2E family transporter [Flavobacterium sp.]|jgi:predicted PurR-regulated permease PerM
MNGALRLPLYAKIAFSLISLIAIVVVLFYGQNIITPALIALLFAILLNPITEFFKKKLRFPHVLAVLFTVTLFIMFFVGLIFFLSWQITDMVSDWEKIKTNVNFHITNLQGYVKDRFGLSTTEQRELIDNATSETGREIVGSTLISVTDTLVNLALIPIYTFLILLYKTHFIKFLCKLFTHDYHGKLQEILMQIKVSVQSYIVGLFLQMLSVSTLTSIGYMIIGAEYAILLGVITGILNLIPYVGIFFACMLSIVATLSGSPDVSIILSVVIVNVVVQFIDNNVLVPMIVSSKVEINALVSIVGIITGGAIAGVAGMFLAIPLLAILKVIFDRIPELSPWGYLMGDDLPKTFRWRRMSLPFFGDDVASDTSTVATEPAKIIYTETTTEDDSIRQQP